MRIVAVLIVAVAIAAFSLAILAEEMGLGAEAARGVFGWKRVSLLLAGVVIAAIGALLLVRPRTVSKLVDWERLGPLGRKVRLVAGLIVVAGIGASGLAILAEELGLGAEAARGAFGWKRVSLLVAGASAAVLGAVLLARPRPIASRIARSQTADDGRRQLDEPQAPSLRVVWVITAVFGLLLLLYSFLFPPHRGPDEPLHIDLVLYVQDTQRYPVDGERYTGESIIASLVIVRFGEQSRDLALAEAPPRNHRPAFADLTPTAGNVNQLAAHPPLYYYVLAAASGAVDALFPGSAFTRPFDQTVWILRLFNVLLLVPLPLVAYLLARELGAPQAGATVAALLPLGIPQLTHIGSVVNNDNLLILLIGLLTLFLVRVARGDLSGRITVIVGILTGLALLTKGSALFVPLWVGLAYGIGGAQTGQWRRTGASFGTAIGVAFAAGGWWWIRNLIAYDMLQPAPPPEWGLPPAPPGFTPDLLGWSTVFVTGMFESYWGLFGWLELRLPLWSILLGSTMLLGGLATTFLAGRDRWAQALLGLTIVAVAALAFGASNVPSWAAVLGSIAVVGCAMIIVGSVALVGRTILAFLSRRQRRSRVEAALAIASIVVVSGLFVYVTHPPQWAVMFGGLALVGGATLTFFSRLERKHTAGPLLAVVPTVAIGGLVASLAYNSYATTGLFDLIQGRYLFPGVVGLAAVTAIGLTRLFGRVSMFLPLTVLVLVTAIQAAGIVTALRFYWASDGSLLGEIRSLAAWSPWSGELLSVPGVLGLILAAWLVRETVLMATSPRRC